LSFSTLLLSFGYSFVSKCFIMKLMKPPNIYGVKMAYAKS
jgi:hypothetical protein